MSGTKHFTTTIMSRRRQRLCEEWSSTLWCDVTDNPWFCKITSLNLAIHILCLNILLRKSMIIHVGLVVNCFVKLAGMFVWMFMYFFSSVDGLFIYARRFLYQRSREIYHFRISISHYVYYDLSLNLTSLSPLIKPTRWVDLLQEKRQFTLSCTESIVHLLKRSTY